MAAAMVTRTATSNGLPRRARPTPRPTATILQSWRAARPSPRRPEPSPHGRPGGVITPGKTCEIEILPRCCFRLRTVIGGDHVRSLESKRGPTKWAKADHPPDEVRRTWVRAKEALRATHRDEVRAGLVGHLGDVGVFIPLCQRLTR